MSTKIVKFKDSNGNNYYSDMPTKTIELPLESVVASGYIRVVRAGRVCTIIINDLKVNSNVTTRTKIASGLPKGHWFMFLTHTNQGSSIYPIFFFDGNGNLYLESPPSVTTGHRILGTTTYINQ